LIIGITGFCAKELSYIHIFNYSIMLCIEDYKLTPWRQNPKVHHHVHKSPPLVPILSQVNSLHTPPPPAILPYIHLLPSSHVRHGLPSGFFSTKTLHTFLPSPKSATCPAHFILFDLNCLTVSGDEYKL
jgi:hypothetical protein